MNDGVVDLYDGLSADSSVVHTVTITAAHSGRQTLTVTGRFRIETTTLEGACGDLHTFATTISVNAAGQLVIPAGGRP